MKLYGIIFDFIHDNIFYTTNETGDWGLDEVIFNIGSISMSFEEWLCHTTTIVCMCLIVVFSIWLVRWVFKAVSSAFLLRR